MSEKYRATIYLERELWDWVRKHSIDKHQSTSEFIEQMLFAYKTEMEETNKPRPSRAKTPKRS